MTPELSRSAEYMRRYRLSNPDYVEANRRFTRARMRALTRLGHAHPDELRALIADELAKESK